MNITIPKGKHYAVSLSRLWHRFIPFCYKKNKVIVFEAQILSQPYDIRPDTDQDDRHKLFGINLNGYKASNVNAMMLSFQANPQDNTWDLMTYTNEDKNWIQRPEFPSKPGDKIRGEFKLLSRNSIELTIYVNEEKVLQTPYVYTWRKAKIKFPVLILPYHGGKDNDGNGIGGVAPEDIQLTLNIKKNGISV